MNSSFLLACCGRGDKRLVWGFMSIAAALEVAGGIAQHVAPHTQYALAFFATGTTLAATTTALAIAAKCVESKDYVEQASISPV